MKKFKINKRKKRHLEKTISIYILMLPAMIYFFINNYLPMFGVVMAFKKINFKLGILKSPWTGLDNFEFLFASGNAWIITRNTVLYNVAFIIIGTIIPITVAIFISDIKNKYASRTYQTLILLPYLMSWVVVSYLAYAFLRVDAGFINKTILPFFGVEGNISFYQEKKYWPYIIIFVNQWKNLGFGTIIYLATIVGIGPEYYEAAKVDGATKWQQIKNVTLPFVKPTVITLFILNLGRMFYSEFGLFYQVPRNSGLIYNVTQTIDTYVYNALMNQNNFGMSSAAGFYQSVIGFLLVITANMIIKKISKENALF